MTVVNPETRPEVAAVDVGEGSWPLPTQVIRDLAATIALLEAQLAVAQLEDLTAEAGKRRQPHAERVD